MKRAARLTETAAPKPKLHLVRSGYPPVSIAPGEQRANYFKALEASNVHPTPYYPNRQGNPEPFIAFITELVGQELARYVSVLTDLEHGDEPESFGSPT